MTAALVSTTAHLLSSIFRRKAEISVSVKPLEWRKSNVADRWVANHAWGEAEIIYDIRSDEYGWFVGGVWFWCKTLDEAKARSQESHDHRILSALSPQPLPEPAIVIEGMHFQGVITEPGDGESFKSCAEWADATFGPATPKRRIERAQEEIEEALTAPPGKLLEEIADAVICLAAAAHSAGGDLQAAIDAKMAINRKRQWNVRGDGTGYHVPASDAAARVATLPTHEAQEPVIWLEFNDRDGFTGLRRWTRDREQATRWMEEPNAGRFEHYFAYPVTTVTEDQVEAAYDAFVAACEWSDWDEPEVRGYLRAALASAATVREG